MLPIVRYTGQALLSPPKVDSCVLSEAMMRGAIVAPFFRCFFINVNFIITGSGTHVNAYLHLPPPITCPHLTIHSFTPSPMPLWFIFHHFLEQWVPNQVFDAFKRIPHPQFHLFNLWITICDKISFFSDRDSLPARTMRERVNSLKEFTVILPR